LANNEIFKSLDMSLTNKNLCEILKVKGVVSRTGFPYSEVQISRSKLKLLNKTKIN
jgi:hypothetical protein